MMAQPRPSNKVRLLHRGGSAACSNANVGFSALCRPVQMFQKALMEELQGLQRIHVTIANQLTRLKVCGPCNDLSFSVSSQPCFSGGDIESVHTV